MIKSNKVDVIALSVSSSSLTLGTQAWKRSAKSCWKARGRPTQEGQDSAVVVVRAEGVGIAHKAALYGFSLVGMCAARELFLGANKLDVPVPKQCLRYRSRTRSLFKFCCPAIHLSVGPGIKQIALGFQVPGSGPTRHLLPQHFENLSVCILFYNTIRNGCARVGGPSDTPTHASPHRQGF